MTLHSDLINWGIEKVKSFVKYIHDTCLGPPKPPLAFHKFLDLPVELRHIIYEYYGIDAANIFETQLLYACGTLRRNPESDHTTSILNVQPPDRPHLHPNLLTSLDYLPYYHLIPMSVIPILRTNRQVRHECLETLSTRFSYEITSPAPLKWSGPDTKGMRQRAAADLILRYSYDFMTALHARVQFAYLNVEHHEDGLESLDAFTGPREGYVDWKCHKSLRCQLQLFPRLRALVLRGFATRSKEWVGCTSGVEKFEGFWQRPQVEDDVEMVQWVVDGRVTRWQEGPGPLCA